MKGGRRILVALVAIITTTAALRMEGAASDENRYFSRGLKYADRGDYEKAKEWWEKGAREGDAAS